MSFSVRRKRLDFDIRELREASVFLLPFWKAAKLFSCLCLAVLGV